MSEKEYKAKCENMFVRNTVLLNENAELENKLNESNELCNKQALRIADLEAQIEKMKCCGNCKHNILGDYSELYCEECCFFGIPNQNMDKWEKAE